MILKGRENLVRFSPPCAAWRTSTAPTGHRHKLARWPAPTSAANSWLPGPKLPNRNLLFKQLLDLRDQQAIEEEARREGISLEKAQKRAHGYMDGSPPISPIG